MTTTTTRQALDELCINTIRTLSMDAVQKANSGHPGAPMALAPVAYLLYTRTMKHNPANPDWFDRDRFVLSAGHASMLLYSILHLTGYGMTLDDLKNFRQLGSPTAGHPEYEADGTPGHRGHHRPARPGHLERRRAWRWPSGCWPRASTATATRSIDHHTYTIASDGDMQEGVASEACSLAGHLGLGRLIAFYDDNHIQLAGPDRRWRFTEDVGKRFEAYGWHVQNLGEDLELGQPRARRSTTAQGGDGPAVADHPAHAHRLRLAEQAGHPRRRTARRSARTRCG